MKVFKFGGASVKNAEAVRNVNDILSGFPDDQLWIVFSAMGKTTNALEQVANAWIKGESTAVDYLKSVESYHLEVAHDLGVEDEAVMVWINKLKHIISQTPPSDYDEGYDRIVSYGELISTSLISAFLYKNSYQHSLLDARKIIITDHTHRNGIINWQETEKKITAVHEENLSGRSTRVFITQGFIGSTMDGKPVTLGREGSDFSAAILAWALKADEMIIWKDVPGVLNADPRYFNDTVKIDRMSYRDAIELAYFGASVIHPKTIQPLQSGKIPLYVKSFYRPAEPGTIISTFTEEQSDQVPSFIVKPDQVLISISPRDFSFIAEGNLHSIFGLLASLDIHLNMMQHSAISFSIVMDNHPDKVDRLFELLGNDFRMKYNSGLQLITIRYYDQETIDKVVGQRKILLEQKSRTTVQLVVSD